MESSTILDNEGACEKYAELMRTRAAQPSEMEKANLGHNPQTIARLAAKRKAALDKAYAKWSRRNHFLPQDSRLDVQTGDKSSKDGRLMGVSELGERGQAERASTES